MSMLFEFISVSEYWHISANKQIKHSRSATEKSANLTEFKKYYSSVCVSAQYQSLFERVSGSSSSSDHTDLACVHYLC